MEQTLHKIDPDKIIIPSERIRKEFNEAKIRKLADSFKKYGQISPILCTMNGEGRPVLVAGERRLRACSLADMEIKYVLKEEADWIMLREIELEENIQRENLTWDEECDAKLELHEFKQEQLGETQPGKPGGHSVKDTAVMLGESTGNVSEDIELAKFAQEFEEVRDAKKKTEAKKIVKRIKDELKRGIKLQKAIIDSGGEKTPEEAAKDDLNEQLLFYSGCIKEGKMEECLQEFKDGFFNIVIWDPPWQVGLSDVRKKGGGTRDFEDSDDPEFKRFADQLKQITKKMADASHLYLFFGIVHYHRVYQVLKDAGLETNGIPIIWYKQGAHVTRNPDIWPGRSYEPIAYARKGSKNLVRKGSPDVIITQMPTEAIKQSHPSAKHPSVMLELLQRSAEPGDKILDPMCGSGMTGVACEVLKTTHKLDWHMIEEKKEFRDLAVINVTQGFNKLVAYKPERDIEAEYQVAPVPDDFKEIEPGSDMWKRYWEQNPGQQDAMLAWKREQAA